MKIPIATSARLFRQWHGLFCALLVIFGNGGLNAELIWSRQDSGTVSRLRSVHMLNNSFGAAAGEDGVVLFFNGSAWKAKNLAGSGFEGKPVRFGAVRVLESEKVILGSADSDERGCSFWNGANWSPKIHAGPNSDSIWSFWNSGGMALVLSARTVGRITRYEDSAGVISENASWTRQLNQAGSVLKSIYGDGSDSIWAVGSGGRIYHSTDRGIEWKQITDPIVSDQTIDWYGVFVLSDQDVWVVGSKSQIAHWDGSSWSVETVRFNDKNTSFNGISGTNVKNLWAVGDNGAIVHYDGEGWASVDPGLGISENLQSISVTPAGNLWVVGAKGVILQGAEPSISLLNLAPEREKVSFLKTPSVQPAAGFEPAYAVRKQ